MNIRFRIGLTLVCAGLIALISSCVKEEIYGVSLDPIKSKYISFGANIYNQSNVTKACSSSEKIASRKLSNHEDSTVSIPLGVYQQKGIASLYTNKLTKGSVFTKDNLNSMKVWATLTTSPDLGSKTISYINGDEFTKQTVEGQDIYVAQDSYLWPGSGTLTFNVLSNLPESGVVYNNTDNIFESFTYTVPTSVAAQNDIVYAKSEKTGDHGQAVELQFEHIMAAVNFKVGDIAHGTIKSITIKGVYNTGKYNFNNGQWAIINQNESHKSDYSVKFNGGNEFSVGEGTATETFINDQIDGIFMMVPQIVPEGATIEVLFEAPNAKVRTLTASIAGDDWGKDIITNYTISIDEQYNLNITPVGKLLDAHYIIAQVEVTVEGMNDASSTQNADQWTLTAVVGGNTENSKVTMLTKNRIAAEESDATKHSNELSMIESGFWCDEYVNRSTVNNQYVYASTGVSARGATQITGTGNYPKELIYILIPENNSTVNRTITLTLQKKNDSKVTKSVVLTQRCPGWTEDGTYGWETVDDDEDGQYGFTFTRKAYYVFAYSFTQQFWGSSTYRHAGFGTINEGIQSVKTNYVDIYAPNIDNFVTFTTVDWGSALGLQQKRYYLTIDYSLLNNLNIKESYNGLKNTLDLYAQGGSAVTSFEQIIANAPKTYRDETGPTFRERDPNNDPAAFPASEGSINDLSGIISYVLKKNKYYLHSYDNGTAYINAPILMSTDDIKWYIPAYGQFETFKPNPNITDKNGGTDSADDYWSSTASTNADDPTLAYSYHGGGIPILRTTELGVIAVRNKDDKTKIIESSTTVDNSSLQGGNNGSTNNWVE